MKAEKLKGLSAEELLKQEKELCSIFAFSL